jgi:hypothetical protein
LRSGTTRELSGSAQRVMRKPRFRARPDMS